MRKREIVSALKKARKLVAAGWVQGTSFMISHATGQDCYCATGAISEIVGSTGCMASRNDAYRAVAKPLSDAIGGSIIGYNDHPSRTQAEVLAMFDKAIAA